MAIHPVPLGLTECVKIVRIEFQIRGEVKRYPVVSDQFHLPAADLAALAAEKLRPYRSPLAGSFRAGRGFAFQSLGQVSP